MTGGKALFLDEWTAKRGIGFLRFDYTGHGQSSGKFEDGCIGDWLRDAADALTQLTGGPQILVGSSMGGWIALLLMRAMPQRMAGLIGIAAAADFTEETMWRNATLAQRRALYAQGHVAVPGDYDDGPYIITRKLIEDGRKHLLLHSPLHAPCPVRLLHGTADDAVPYETALRLIDHIEGNDVRSILLRGADHRLSNPAELVLLAETLDGLLSYG